jgi:hypothetical protein
MSRNVVVGMQTGENPTVDANAVHPPEIHKDDPRRLENLMSKIYALNAQSASDTKYDPKPPPRVDRNGNEVSEAFEDALDTPDIKLIGELIYAFGALSLIVLVMCIFTYIDPKMYRSISEVHNGTLYIKIAAGLSIVNLLFSYFSLKSNEIIQWYPALKDARVWY